MTRETFKPFWFIFVNWEEEHVECILALTDYEKTPKR